MTDVFWIDAEYDRDQSSDGISRYGAYVRQGWSGPWCGESRPAELASFAWRRATGPVMAPGYVRMHPRVRSASLGISDWDGSLIAAVDLIAPQPKDFRYLRSDRGTWKDWPAEGWRDLRYHEPYGDELDGKCFLLTTIGLRFTVPAGDLPAVPGEGEPLFTTDQLVAACTKAVAVLVREMNAAVRLPLDRIEGS
jgi:hypothetical protein